VFTFAFLFAEVFLLLRLFQNSLSPPLTFLHHLAQVAEMTASAMGGSMKFEHALAARLDLIKPSRNDVSALCHYKLCVNGGCTAFARSVAGLYFSLYLSHLCIVLFLLLFYLPRSLSLFPLSLSLVLSLASVLQVNAVPCTRACDYSILFLIINK
jgi:hypothetical protein